MKSAGYYVTEQNGVVSVRRDGAICANGVQFVVNLNSNKPMISCRTKTLGGLGNYCQGRAKVFGDPNEDVVSKTPFKANSADDADVGNFIVARRKLFAFLTDAARLARVQGDRRGEQDIIDLKSKLQQKLR